MSHFTVMVIGNNIEEQLQKFHEFESTGENDSYVQDIDITQEVIDSYKAANRKMYVSPDGEKFDAYDDRFYRDPTEEEKSKVGIFGSMGFGNGISYISNDWNDGLGYRPKVHYMPEGYKEEQVGTSSLESLLEYTQNNYGYKTILIDTQPDLLENHKCGYIIIDENTNVIKIIKRTNPNAKWDWYIIGGRWSGYFRAKDKNCENNGLGKPGVFENIPKPGYYDQILKGNIDIEYMKNHAYNKAKTNYEIVQNLFGGEIPKLEIKWKDMFEGDYKDMDSDKRRSIYHNQEGNLKLKSLKDTMMMNSKGRKMNEDEKLIYWLELDDFQCTKEEYCIQAMNAVIPTFAILKDGEWYEEGKMGWWGVAHNEKDENKWQEEFNKLFDSLSDDTLITIVDCHI